MLPRMPRGRPPNPLLHPRLPNRLREFRETRGLTQQQLADNVTVTMQHISEIERGNRDITRSLGRRLAAALQVSLAEILGDSPGVSVPLRYLVGAAAHENRPDEFELKSPYLMLPIGPRVSDPRDCFAAELVDDSADRDFPPHSQLFFREVAPGADLPIGTSILVRFLGASEPGRQPVTREILLGRLDVSYAGDLLLLTRSRNRAVPSVMAIQRAPIADGFRDAAAPVAREKITYEIAFERDGIILGVLVWFSRAP